MLRYFRWVRERLEKKKLNQDGLEFGLVITAVCLVCVRVCVYIISFIWPRPIRLRCRPIGRFLFLTAVCLRSRQTLGDRPGERARARLLFFYRHGKGGPQLPLLNPHAWLFLSIQEYKRRKKILKREEEPSSNIGRTAWLLPASVSGRREMPFG